MLVDSTFDELPNEEFLRSEYVGRGRSITEIAEQAGCEPAVVAGVLHRHDIAIRPRTDYSEILTKEYLTRAYVDEGRSIANIAREVGCVSQTVRTYLLRHRIALRQTQGFRSALTAEYLNRRLVEEGASLEAVAREVGCTVPTVKWHARHNEVPIPGSALDTHGTQQPPRPKSRRSPPKSPRFREAEVPLQPNALERSKNLREILTEDYLREVYEREHQTTAEIAERVGCSASTVCDYLRSYDIKTVKRRARGMRR